MLAAQNLEFQDLIHVRTLTTMNAGNQAIPGQQEAALLDFVGRIHKNTAGRRAIHVRMSALQPQNREPKRLHIASLAFEPLISGFEGSMFRLHNNDIVVFSRGASLEIIQRAVTHLQNLFADDPAVKNAGPDLLDFCTHFDVSSAYGSVLALAQQALETARETQATHGATAATSRQRELDPKILGSIQTAISRADLTNVIRRQLVCVLAPGQPPQPIFSEVFTSMSALRKIVSPDIDMFKNRWLFQDLTTHLDRRVITYLAHRDDSSLQQAFSVNLNISSLGSPEFLSFDQGLSSETRRTVVIELQLIDIMADLGDFLFARNFLRERRYRFCLDGLTHHSLPMVNCQGLGVDLVKIIWSPELHDKALGKDSAIHEAVAAIDAKRVILIRCDDERAIETGRALGVSLFQGYLIDKMLKARRAPKPAAQ